MTVLKSYNTGTSAWEPVAIGSQGVQGAQGATGAQGTTGVSGVFTSSSVSSNITLANQNNYFVDTSATRTLTLPASPALGDEIHVFDATGSAATNNITVSSNSLKINGSVQDLTIDKAYAGVVLIYTGSTYGWRVS